MMPKPCALWQFFYPMWPGANCAFPLGANAEQRFLNRNWSPAKRGVKKPIIIFDQQRKELQMKLCTKVIARDGRVLKRLINKRTVSQ